MRVDADIFSHDKLMRELPGLVSLFNSYGFTDEAEGTAVGEARVQQFYPAKSLSDGRVVIAASSDFPFTIDPNPFIAMQVGVTRNMPDGAEDLQWYGLPSITDMDDPTQLLAPQERMTIEEMIRAYMIKYSRPCKDKWFDIGGSL